MAVSHKGAISFGMVHIPVGLYTVTQDNDIHFDQLCKENGRRVKYRKVCAGCGKEIGSEDIVKGLEYKKGKYVTLMMILKNRNLKKMGLSIFSTLQTFRISVQFTTIRPVGIDSHR